MVLEDLLSQLDVDRVTRHVEWLTNETPSRISGLGQDRKAAEYIVCELRKYGLEAGIWEFTTYNSQPGEGSLEVISPIKTEVPCIPCAHIAGTPPGGLEAELVYVGPGGEDDYESVDVKDKFVLAEVSYAPATPEKARIAWDKGAAGMVLVNWGTKEEDVICMRALKAVWGNPTTKTFDEIPQVCAVTISRPWGERLRDLCLRGKVTVKMNVSSVRKWETLPQPYGFLKGAVEPDKVVLVAGHVDAWEPGVTCNATLPQPYGFLKGAVEPDKVVLVAGHVDAWEPGVTCNATGDATMLEIARVLAQNRAHLRRSICFAFWNGHEIAEAAGSTWFVDNFWPEISKNYVAYINVDSTGMKGTSQFKVSVSRELSDMVKSLSEELLEEPVEVSYLTRTGDQSFFGVGVPAIAGRYSFSDEYVKRTHGATLGWWNHTIEDTLDKYDPEVMAKDIKVQMGYIWRLATDRVLPYSAARLVADAEQKIKALAEESKNVIDLNPILAELKRLDAGVNKLYSLDASSLTDEQAALLNKAQMAVSRYMTNVLYTKAERFEQDSYGLSILSKPIPLLYPVIELQNKDRASQEYMLLETELLRARNRVWEAVNGAADAVEFALKLLEC